GPEPVDGAGAPRNFEEWIVRRFGGGIAKHFMLPYNRKLWARNLARLSCDWVAERVAAPRAEPAGADRRPPLQADTIVGYPARGGFGEIYRKLAERVRTLHTRRTVVRIDPVGRVAQTDDGATFRWQRLVSTMPLPRLLGLAEGVPRALVE